MSFDYARAVGQDKSGSDGVKVLTEEAAEGPDRPLTASFALADPLGERMAPAVSDQVGEGTGEIARFGDVRAGQRDAFQLSGLKVRAFRMAA